jgi:hypothetical protein
VEVARGEVKSITTDNRISKEFFSKSLLLTVVHLKVRFCREAAARQALNLLSLLHSFSA